MRDYSWCTTYTLKKVLVFSYTNIELFQLRHISQFLWRGSRGSCHVGVQATPQNVRQKALILEFFLTAEIRAGFQVTFEIT